MVSLSKRFKNWGAPERIAAWAGSLGFTLSVIFLSLYLNAGNSASAAVLSRAALEHLFILLWPSAILMTGAHTFSGAAILFLLAASLNAGYYVFISLSGYLVCRKLEFFAASAGSLEAAPVRVYQAPRLIQHVQLRAR
jgi:hypothetical protein